MLPLIVEIVKLYEDHKSNFNDTDEWEAVFTWMPFDSAIERLEIKPFTDTILIVEEDLDIEQVKEVAYGLNTVGLRVITERPYQNRPFRLFIYQRQANEGNNEV